MVSRRKIATVSGLIGSLAVIYVGGAAQAHADGSPGDCKTTAVGETTCVHKTETVHKGKDGTYVAKQAQECSTIYRPRVVLPEDSMDTGSTNVGPVVECSNTAPLPKGFKRPHITRPHIEF
ncbi:hypothetical protein [Streptomyces sp. NBC_00078]|uniref:hypothetical protein n=1 Tax=unclassified Streptomyces TaxID=2593676 RepID=UPI002251A8BD|nr:hypothetical protein [Streptomyces sp. NBC_00078]MCX5421749.1 hypothetical protein [Streptomyces sp. NBC_00078]